jgi:hypothetical protein
MAATARNGERGPATKRPRITTLDTIETISQIFSNLATGSAALTAAIIAWRERKNINRALTRVVSSRETSWRIEPSTGETPPSSQEGTPSRS